MAEAKSKPGANVHTVLAKAQAEFPVLEKDGEVRTNRYSFKYATLDKVIATTVPVLSKHGLCLTQLVDGDVMATVLTHGESGTSIESRMNLPRANDLKDMGACLTYAKRYSLVAMLALSADEDIDAPDIEVRPPPKRAEWDVCPDTDLLRRIADGEEDAKAVFNVVRHHLRNCPDAKKTEFVEANWAVISELVPEAGQKVLREIAACPGA